MGHFGFESTTDDVLDGIDLTGRHAVVTGASTGLGEETARALAAHGAKVTLAVRDTARGEAAADRIRTAIGGPTDLEIRRLELDDLASVRAFASAFVADHDHLDLLINNAGIMACPFGRTVDGHELQFGTNHLGHFLLGELLAPLLVAAAERTGDARLVSLSSRGHSFGDIDLDDPDWERRPYDPFGAYGASKTANVLFAVGFDARYAAHGVHAFSVHPGGIHTELGRHMTPEVIARMREMIANRGGSFRWKTIPQGAATSCLAATAADLLAHGGAYLEDCGIAEVVPEGTVSIENGVQAYAIDPARAEQLWELSERLVSR